MRRPEPGVTIGPMAASAIPNPTSMADGADPAEGVDADGACRMAHMIWSGGTIRREQMDDPRHSLARWPAIEREVQTYMAASPWLITDGPDAA